MITEFCHRFPLLECILGRNIDKNKPSRSDANGWFIFWKIENKSLRKPEMEALFFAFTSSVHVSQ